MVARIKVIAPPAPQGSKSFKGFAKDGHAILAESSKQVKPWRDSVVSAARENLTHFVGAVSLSIYFTLPKPKSAPKTRQTWPDKKPDLDKLCRSTFDALKTAGVIEDDSRVVRLETEKVFPGEHEFALDVPGALIEVRSMLPSL